MTHLTFTPGSLLPVGAAGRARSGTKSTNRRSPPGDREKGQNGTGKTSLTLCVQTPGQEPQKRDYHITAHRRGGALKVSEGKGGLVHLGASVACYVFIFVVSAIISVFMEERRQKANCAGAAEA